jgi:hypothetical protein
MRYQVITLFEFLSRIVVEGWSLLDERRFSMKKIRRIVVATGLLLLLLSVSMMNVTSTFAVGGPKQPPTHTKTLTPLTQLPTTRFTLPGVSSAPGVGPTVQLYCFNPVIGSEDHFVVYIGTDYQINIFDVSDSANYTTGQYSYSTPGVACFNGRLYVAWSSETLNNAKLYVGYLIETSPGEGSLGGIVSVPGQTTDGGSPALTAGGSNWSTMYVGWVASNALHNLYIEQSNDGTNWTNRQSFADSTHQYAGFTLFGDDTGSHPIYATWVSSTATPTINLALYQGTNSWAWKYTFASDWSPDAPGIVVYSGKVYFVWTGGSAQNTVSNIYTGCWNNNVWHGNVEQSDTTSGNVSLDGDGTNFVAAFTGTDSNNSVNYLSNWYGFPPGC